MSDWVDFDQWINCPQMERPGYVFEVENSEGLRVVTPCANPFPRPWDWTSEPVRFRLIEEPKPRHSTPMPEPQKQD